MHRYLGASTPISHETLQENDLLRMPITVGPGIWFKSSYVKRNEFGNRLDLFVCIITAHDKAFSTSRLVSFPIILLLWLV